MEWPKTFNELTGIKNPTFYNIAAAGQAVHQLSTATKLLLHLPSVVIMIPLKKTHFRQIYTKHFWACTSKRLEHKYLKFELEEAI